LKVKPEEGSQFSSRLLSLLLGLLVSAMLLDGDQ
jgi:hypothetical protein